MNKRLKKVLCSLTALAMTAGMGLMPVAHAEYTPMFDEDEGKVVNEWKFDFGSADDVEDGYTAVTPDRNVITSGDYGFIGNDSNGYKVSPRYDGFVYQEGQNMNLQSGGTSGLYDGVGIVKDDTAARPEYTTGEYYPVSFGMYVDEHTYYRVRATVTTLDPTQDATASLYYERRHPVYKNETIEAGGTKTVEFSVAVENIYFQKSDPTGTFTDDMLNIELLGENSALAALEIQQVEDGITLWVIGDSTVTDGNASVPFFDLQNYTGVGAGLSMYVPKNVAVSNQGEGGLAASDNAHFNMIKNNIASQDYMYMEYGHNHKNDGVAGYLTYLEKYYNAANAVGAKMIYVGPIDRCNTYDSSTNTWSSSLSGFSNAAKRYTDLLILGGTTMAAEYVTLYQTSTDDAETYYQEKLAAGITDAGVDNAAFVDLNEPSLRFFESRTASGTVNDEEVTNEVKLVYYYFQCARGGSVDHTHPNDAGSQAMAQLFFDYASDSSNYTSVTGDVQQSVLSGLTTDSKLYGDAKMVDPEIINLGYPSNSAWPVWESLVEYDFPTYIKKLSFDDDKKLTSASVVVQDSMPSYGWVAVAKYDEESGALTGISFADSQVDNSTGKGTQTVEFSDGITIGDNETYKGYVWEYKDDTEVSFINRFTGVPYSYVYLPSDIEEYLLLGDDDATVETFQYYGLGDGDAIDSQSITGYTFSGSASEAIRASHAATDDERAYLELYSNGAKSEGSNNGSYMLQRALDTSASSGIVNVDFDIKYTSGNAVVELEETKGSTGSYPNALKISVSDGTVSVAGTEVGEINTDTWAHISVDFDLDLETATASINNSSGVTVNTSEISAVTYLGFIAGSPKSFDYDIADLSIAKLVRQEALPTCTFAASIDDSCADMGTITAQDGEYSFKSLVTVSAAANDGYRFEGWYDEEGNLVSANESYSFNIKADTTLKAFFSEVVLPDGFYYEDDFEDYTTGTKVVQGSNGATVDDVTLGDLTLSAGTRSNGTGDGTSGVYVEESDSNKYLTAKSGNTANSSRGAKITFKHAVTFGDTPIVWAFDTKFSNGAQLDVTNIGSFTQSELGLDADTWGQLEFIFDKTNSKLYIITLSESGVITKITESTLSASELSDMTFYVVNQTISFDNMKIYDLGSENTDAAIPSDVTVTVLSDSGTAVEGATVTLASASAVTDANGQVTLQAVEGILCSAQVECTGYEDFSGTIAPQDAAATVTLTAKTAAAATVRIQFVDENGSEIISDTVVSDLYEGDSYTADDSLKKTIKNTSDGKLDVYTWDSSNDMTIDSLAAGENTLTVTYTSQGTFDCYEDFEYSSDTSMITSSSNSVNSVIEGNKTNTGYFLRTQNQNGKGGSAVYTLSSSGIGADSTATFHGLVSLGSSNSKDTIFALQSTSGAEIFNMTLGSYASTFTISSNDVKSKITTVKGGGITSAGSTSDTPWLDVTAVVDFTQTEDNVTLTVLDTSNSNAVVYSGTLTTSAENIGKISTTLGKSYSGMGYDDIWVK